MVLKLPKILEIAPKESPKRQPLARNMESAESTGDAEAQRPSPGRLGKAMRVVRLLRVLKLRPCLPGVPLVKGFY